MGELDIVVHPDAGAAAAAVAALLAETVDAGGSLVLSGGSTPRRAYELAAALDGDWGGVDLWFGDDRCVPAYDPRSNQLLVREALLDRIIVHADRASDPDRALAGATPLPPTTPSSAASRSISSCSASARTVTPHRSFPARPALDVRDRLAVAAEPGLEPFVERVTLTIPALESGAHVVFLVVGAEKADAARRAFSRGAVEGNSRRASSARATGRTTVILDAAAARFCRGSAARAFGTKESGSCDGGCRER